MDKTLFVIATWGMSVIGGYRQVGCFSLEEDKGLGTNNHLYPAL